MPRNGFETPENGSKTPLKAFVIPYSVSKRPGLAQIFPNGPQILPVILVVAFSAIKRRKVAPK